ncbi:MAG: hypothetical protein U0900_11815 [Myxococcota bacterium]
MIRAVATVLAALATFALAGCQTFSARQKEARYSPTEGVLEAVAVLRRHVPDDTYRFPPARDFTGRNVYRASLLRLEALERAEAAALQSGYMDAVIAFAKGRALERLRAFDLAAQHYRASARISNELRASALASAEVCERLDQAIRVGIDFVDPVAENGVPARPIDPDGVRAALEERVTRLSILLDELADEAREKGAPAAGPPARSGLAGAGSDGAPASDAVDPVDRRHYRWIAQEEIERADMVRARYFVEIRHVVPDGTVVALQELQRVATRHGASKNRLRHLMRLGDFYADLAREYLDAVPPESLVFDPARFRELADAAIQLYELVGSHDGRPEKLEATRNLEAFLALTLHIDADRFDR